MMWFAVFAFGVGVITSSMIWGQFYWKMKGECKPKALELSLKDNCVLDETVICVNEIEKAIELQNCLAYQLEELRLETQEIESRERELVAKEGRLAEREYETDKQVAEMESQLKGSRENCRRQKKKNKELNARLGDRPIEED